MTELEQLARDAHAELGEPTEAWLRAQKGRARRALLLPEKRKNRLGLAWTAVAAAIALGVGIFSLRAARSEAPPQAETALVAAAQAQRVRLADGSAVSLAAGGQARFGARVDGTHFELERGLAEFEVTPQHSRQFVVVAGAIEVSVVGTRFSVRYEPPSTAEVHVTEGTVSVRAPGRHAPLLLRAGEHFRARGSEFVLERATAASAAPPPLASTSVAKSAPSASPVESSQGSAAPALDWEALYRERRYAASLALAKGQGFERLLSLLPARKLADLADAARLGGDAGLALRALNAIQRRFPGAREASDAEFLIGRVHAARGEAQVALARFEKYLQYGEQAPYAVEAMGRLVELYAGRGQAGPARAMAERYLARAPNGPYRRLCLSVLEKR